MSDDAEVRRCPICRGSGWIVWVNDWRGRKPSQVAVPADPPANTIYRHSAAEPYPECRRKEYQAWKEDR
jgi:hypothetical protein